MKTKVRFNKIIALLLISFILITLLTILLVFLNDYGVFNQKPTVDIRPDNTYTETLRVATDYDYKPFSYIEDGEYAGLDVELIIEVANRLGMNLDLTLLDWTDAQKGLMDGTFDIILNMESNAILKNDSLIGTIPTDEKQYVVYGKNEISYVGELYGTRVAAYNRFDELGMNVITGYSYQEMFEKLLKDELDYVICPIQIGDNFVEKIHAQRTIVSSYQVSYMYGCMALKASDTKLCARLNQVIKELQTEGVIEKLDRKWVTSRYVFGSIKDILLKNPIIIVMLVIGVQLVVFGTLYLVFISINSRKQKVYAAELQKNLAIIHQQNEELKVAGQKAQAASIAKSNFLFNMSHDIRTPMNAIIGFTNLAKSHVTEPDVLRDYLTRISASSDLLLGLINDVLEMARIENGKTQLNLGPEDLALILDQVDAIIHAQANDKHQELIFESRICHRYVLCDKLKLHQVMINLISNAIKYTEPGGHILVRLEETDFSCGGKANEITNTALEPGRRAETILLEGQPSPSIIEKGGEEAESLPGKDPQNIPGEAPSGEKERAHYLLTVKDDGIGMSEEFQSRIFEPFEREKNTTVSRIPGTGLGMSIIKSLLDLMGATISLTSRLGEGSEFILQLDFALAPQPETGKEPSLPQAEEGTSAPSEPSREQPELKMQDSQEAEAQPEQEKPAPSPSGQPSSPQAEPAAPPTPTRADGSKYQILVVDDNEINRMIATELLRGMGYETQEACDGQEAIEMVSHAKEGDFDLILMDIQMPTVNGYQASKAIREMDSPLSSIPILALTANAYDDDRKNAQEAGMNDHVAKPIDIDLLEKTIAKYLGF